MAQPETVETLLCRESFVGQFEDPSLASMGSWRPDQATADEELHFYTQYCVMVDDFLPRFELGSIPIDERLCDRIMHDLLNDEALRMLHVTVMERVCSHLLGPEGLDPFKKLVQLRFKTVPLIVPLISLNDHMGPTGYHFMVNESKQKVLANVTELATKYVRFWTGMGVRVTVRPPVSFLLDPDILYLDYLLVEFHGYYESEYDQQASMEAFYNFCQGDAHPLFWKGENESVKLPHIRLVNPADFGVGNLSSSFLNVLRETLKADDLRKWEHVVGELIAEDAIPFADTGYTYMQYFVRFQLLAYRHYSARDREPLRYSMRACYLYWMYLLDFNFMCMFHYHCGTACRQWNPSACYDMYEPMQKHDRLVPYPHLSMRMNALVPDEDRTVLGDVASQSFEMEYICMKDYVIRGESIASSSFMFNWHMGMCMRHCGIMVPAEYWDRLKKRLRLDAQVEFEHVPNEDIHMTGFTLADVRGGERARKRIALKPMCWCVIDGPSTAITIVPTCHTRFNNREDAYLHLFTSMGVIRGPLPSVFPSSPMVALKESHEANQERMKRLLRNKLDKKLVPNRRYRCHMHYEHEVLVWSEEQVVQYDIYCIFHEEFSRFLPAYREDETIFY